MPRLLRYPTSVRPLQLRVGSGRQRWAIRRLTPTFMRVAGSPLAPGVRTFVQIDMHDALALGLTVIATAHARRRDQVLTPCSDEDRRILALAHHLAGLRLPATAPIVAPEEVPDVA